MIGHCLGAAGGLEAIATVKAITTGWLHPTINQFVSPHASDSVIRLKTFIYKSILITLSTINAESRAFPRV